MNPVLLDLPFDHFQRYSSAARIIHALGKDTLDVLEVGANRQRLMGKFLPDASVLYSDVDAAGDDQDFVIADATCLPFKDAAFTSVVSLDVLEHIPAHLRERAIAEMARVAGSLVVIGCPLDLPWVHEAEARANEYWHQLFGSDYEWLAEHKQFGLVDGNATAAILEKAGMRVIRLGHGDPLLWSELMALHFTKVKFPETEPLTAASDRLYNSRICKDDVQGTAYREYFIAVRSDEDHQRAAASLDGLGVRDEEVVSILKSAAGGIQAFASRTHRSELGWEATSRAMAECSADLEQAKGQWASTATLFQNRGSELERAAHERQTLAHALSETTADLEVSRHEWASTAELLSSCTSELTELRLKLDRSSLQLVECGADLDVAKREWNATAQLLDSSNADLDVCKREWSATAQLLDARSADLELATREWAATAELVRARDAELQRQRQDLARNVDLLAECVVAGEAQDAQAAGFQGELERMQQCIVEVRASAARRAIEEVRLRRRLAWTAAAAAVLMLVVGSVVGWWLA